MIFRVNVVAPRAKMSLGIWSVRVSLFLKFPSPVAEGFFPRFTSMFTVGRPSHVALISAAIIIPMCDRSEIRFGRGPGARSTHEAKRVFSDRETATQQRSTRDWETIRAYCRSKKTSWVTKVSKSTELSDLTVCLIMRLNTSQSKEGMSRSLDL